MIQTLKRLFSHSPNKVTEQQVIAGYDAWAPSYDAQPGNLVLHLDEQIVSAWLAETQIEDRKLADIGCGTGRHWAAILVRKPAMLAGFDVSAGMLNRLREKYPAARVEQTTDDRLLSITDGYFDFLISTLTLAHMEHAETAIHAWARVLRPGGEIILTDFHPVMLQNGAKRSFSLEGRTLAVESHIHPLDLVIGMASKAGLELIDRVEKKVDESVRHFYEAQNALPSYHRYKNVPVIYGLRFKKNHAAS